MSVTAASGVESDTFGRLLRRRRVRATRVQTGSEGRPRLDSRETFAESSYESRARCSAGPVSLATSIANTTGSLADAIGPRFRAGRSSTRNASRPKAETAIPRGCGRAASTLAGASVRSRRPVVAAKRDSRLPSPFGHEPSPETRPRSCEIRSSRASETANSDA